MQLNQHTENVIVSSTDNTHTSFMIAMNAKAFKALSDSLYKNKIGTIVREISCNAFDAHISAKKSDEPFEIHLPNALEPYFAVKDFGTGISHQNMITLYSTFFESTKDKSNDEIGGFGLGSKTPYSYTDSFTVTSIIDGIKTHYSAYLNEGLPTISRLHTEYTTESNGVEVRIGVKKEDYRKFQHEVQEQLQYFNVKPTIINGTVVYDDYFNTPVLSTENITLGNSNNGRSQNVYENIAILGVVGYPIDSNIMRQHLLREDIKFLETICSISVLKFKIGEIEVTASREGISYTEQTIKNIVKKIHAARTDVLEYLKNSIDNIPLPWDKAVFVNKCGKLTKLYIASGLKIPNTEIHNDLYCFTFHKLLETTQYYLVTYKFSRTGKYRREPGVNNYITPKDNRVVFLRDIEKQPILRIREYNSQNPELEIYVLEPQNTWLDAPEYTAQEMTNLLQKYSEAMGGITIHQTSTLPEYKKPKQIKFRTSNGDSNESDAEKIDYTVPKGYEISLDRVCDLVTISSRTANPVYDISELSGVYMLCEDRKILRSRATYNNIDRNVDDLLNTLNRFTKKEDKLTKIYIINNKHAKKITKNPNLVTIEEYTKQEYTKLLKNVEFVKILIALNNIMDKVENWIPPRIMNELVQSEYLKKLNKKSAATPIIRLFNVINIRYKHKLNDVYSYIHTFPELFSNNSTESKIFVKFTETFETVNNKLPLLSDLQYYSFTKEKMEHLVKYINIMGQ